MVSVLVLTFQVRNLVKDNRFSVQGPTMSKWLRKFQTEFQSSACDLSTFYKVTEAIGKIIISAHCTCSEMRREGSLD